MKYLIIQGSARSKGNSSKIAEMLKTGLGADHVDLKVRNIHGYSYDHEYSEDDFLPLMRDLVSYDCIIFVTPIYWYSMSGLMKNFFDRISDCLKVEKELGRKLRGMSMAAVACGSDEVEIDGYFVPFKLTAGYLGMEYLGDIHTWIENNLVSEEVIVRIENFMAKLKSRSLDS